MDWMKAKAKILSWIKKYRYVILVITIGLVLMNIPSNKNTESEIININSSTIESHPETEETENKLKFILGRISGVGEVDVMLTLACGQQTIYQVDSESTIEQDRTSNQTQTVIVSDSNRANTGLIARVDSPKYMGAIIVCKGGGDPSVQLAVIDAVSKALGLSSDKISVLKMN